MLIEEMLNKRDLATNICVAIQNQLGGHVAGVFEMDDFERRTTEEFNEYVDSEMKRLDFKVMIFTGWAFTKELFKKQYEYSINTTKCTLYLPELNTLIIADSDETFKFTLKHIKPEILAVSFLNIRDIKISDNAIQIDYLTKTVVKYFEERPKSVEEIIQNEKYISNT